jgi:hypothetical protein
MEQTSYTRSTLGNGVENEHVVKTGRNRNRVNVLQLRTSSAEPYIWMLTVDQVMCIGRNYA